VDEKTDLESHPDNVQVFEVTMDNVEDQEELNRRLRKPGERDVGAPATKERSSAAVDEANGKRGKKEQET
jgi:hypothetical protein